VPRNRPFPRLATTAGGWLITSQQASAQTLHDRQIDPDPTHSVWVNQVARPALVLGSSQPDQVVDAARAGAGGFEVCRRHSGGGLVVVRPGLDTWIDLIVPAHSELWSVDVGRAFHWLGEVWVGALRALTPSALVSMHRGPLRGGQGGKLVCFASLGPGEVTIEGRKLVGISQRRTARAARFQCVVTWQWYPDLLGRFLDPAHLEQAQLDLDTVPAGWDASPPPPPQLVADTFINLLPTVG
jgi:lipoate-protein ligase A